MLFRIFAFSLFAVLASSEASAQKPINNSSIAFTLSEKDLLPESVAYDSQTHSFFVGSTRKGKVIRVDADGNESDFIDHKTFGLWMVIGMKADVKQRHLWLCSSGGDNLIDYTYKDDVEGRPAGIFQFDLDTGKLISKYLLPAAGEVHFFNDLIIAPNGDVYATHMFNEASIYRVAADGKTFELFAESPDVKYPNGLALADNGKTLFIAHSAGISSLNLQTKAITQLAASDSMPISGKESLDGLYYYKWSLIGIKSGTNQVVQLMLNQDGSGFESTKILERDHPMMNRPTTGVLIGNELYYIANAQFDSFDEDRTLYPMERLYQPVVLKVSVAR